jgi:DNA primase
MASRIPQHFIDQLLNRTDVVDVIDAYVPLKKAGANFKACCPFHNEKTPSFTVSPSKQFYHCFGCGANGTAISFLMDYDHMEFREAIEKLASHAGLEIPVEAVSYDRKKSVSQGIDLYDLMNQVNDFYQAQLRQHANKQEAVQYLKQRGLSGDTAKKFGIGFAPQGWDNLISQFGKSDPAIKALLDTGMLSENESGRKYDRFRHRIMFPIHDHRGRVVGFGGRVMGQEEPKYLNSPETPIFHKGSELYGLFAARGGIKDANGVLVVEGYMDVVALAQAGINNAVATLGTATTAMHLQRLFRHTPNITFSFDGDRAGRAAAWKALQTCLPQMQDGYQISFLFLPDGEDPDSMVAKIGQQAFLKLVANATPLPDFLTDSLQQQADINRLDRRAKLNKLAKPMLTQLPDGVLKQLIADRLARLIQVSAHDLLDGKRLDAQSSNRPKQKRRPSSSTNSHSPMTLVRRVISLLLQQPSLAKAIPDELDITAINIRGMQLLVQLVEACNDNQTASTASLLERHRQEPHFQALEKLASHDHLLEQDQIESTFIALLKQLHEQANDDQLEQLLEKSKHEALSPQDKDILKQLLSRG